jgi:hypothetical protein
MLTAATAGALAQSNQPVNPGQIPGGPQPPAFVPPPDLDPAINEPDKLAWQLFAKVTAPAASAGNNNVLFETWASDDQTFTQNPQWPTTAPVMRLKVPALERAAAAQGGLQPQVLEGGGEEVRRNKPTFDFIVNNNLFTQSGLKAAFQAKKDISFPSDSIEVKARWVPANTVDASKYHVNTANGQQFALVAVHIISKEVPNWTWATFEHQDNRGRCDFIGCHDSFGATVADVAAQTPTGQAYAACAKTAALKKMMTDANLEGVFANYCLKGSQVDFTTATGMPTLLGNTVIERGFVNTSSCMTCHARASTDAGGGSPQGVGFLDPPIPALCPTPGKCSPNGTPNPTWFWNNPGTPQQSIKTLPTDFVWAIPFNAIP